MEPTLFEGDRLVVLHGGRPRIGGLAVLRLPDGVIGVKRVSRREQGGWYVVSDNSGVGARDSTLYGALPDSAVLARVLVRLPRRRRS
jgi:phage repressor protein C with HTH and peptisase S24 domain